MRTRWDLMPRRIKRPGMLAGGDGSTLSLEFTAMSSLDSRFTFTRASTGTYINSAGLVTTMAAASTNDPTKARFDYDPTTLAPRGLLIEGSATNLLNWSESFATSGGAFQWNYNLYITRNATQIVGPDGTQNAYRFNETTDNQIHRISYPGATGSAGSYVLSVWVQIIDASAPRRLFINGISFMGAGALFDIDPATQTGASGSAVAVSGSAGNRAGTWVKYPNNWYRCSLLGTYVANSTIYLQINRASSTTATDDTFAGSTSNGLALWGAQLEAGSGASSYVFSGASQGQRAADSCSIAASSSWLNTASGTFLATWSRGDLGTAARTAISTDYVAGRLLSLNNTNTTGTVVLDWWNGNINRTTGSSSNKAAYTYGQTTGSGATLQLPVRLCVNGSAVATGTFGNGTTNGADVPNPVNWTNFVIGAASQSAPYTTASRDWLNNCVRSIKYWPTILPDATLQSLTQ